MAKTERVDWLSPFGDADVTILEARHCARPWRLYHEAYSFCAVHAIDGHGPRLRYRQWDQIGVPHVVQLYEPGEVHECVARGFGDFSVLVLSQTRFNEAARSLGAKGSDIHFDRLTLAEGYGALLRFSQLLAAPHGKLALDVQLASCIEALVRASSGFSPRPARPDRRAVFLAKEYLDAAAEGSAWGELRLATVVQASGASSNTALCRDFARQFKISPYRYYKLRRMAFGRRLLDAGKAVRAAAWACGYDHSVFSREFSRSYGIPPSVYRSRFRASV